MFLDLRSEAIPLGGAVPDDDERGLLGLAFHPDFENNGRFFALYTEPLRAVANPAFDPTNVIVEDHATDDAIVDLASRKLILEVDQPYFNHNGGTLAFGPDGYLYIGLGDGGNENDVGLGHPLMGNGQDVRSLLGSILRIDVDTSSAYEIPQDHPLVSVANADPETYA